MISDKPEGWLNLISTTEKIQNDYEGTRWNEYFYYMAQKLSFKSQSIELNCKGFTGISVGDLCSFEVPSYEPVSEKIIHQILIRIWVVVI